MAMVLIHKARQTNGPFIIYFYFCLIGGDHLFPFWAPGFQGAQCPPWDSVGLVALHASHWTASSDEPWVQNLQGLRRFPDLMSEIVFAGVAGVLLFKDPVTYHFIVGGFLIIGSGVGLNLISRDIQAFSEPIGISKRMNSSVGIKEYPHHRPSRSGKNYPDQKTRGGIEAIFIPLVFIQQK